MKKLVFLLPGAILASAFLPNSLKAQNLKEVPGTRVSWKAPGGKLFTLIEATKPGDDQQHWVNISERNGNMQIVATRTIPLSDLSVFMPANPADEGQVKYRSFISGVVKPVQSLINSVKGVLKPLISYVQNLIKQGKNLTSDLIKTIADARSFAKALIGDSAISNLDTGVKVTSALRNAGLQGAQASSPISVRIAKGLNAASRVYSGTAASLSNYLKNG